MRAFFLLLLLAPAAWAQTATIVVAPGEAAALEADLRDAADGLMYLMSPTDNAAALKSATDNGVTCIDNDLRCWERVSTLAGGGSVIVLRPPLAGVPAELWFSAAGIERKAVVLSAGTPGMRYALERLQEKNGAIVVKAEEGCQVTLDGQAASTMMQGVPAGDHVVVVVSSSGTQSLPVTVTVGRIVELEAPSGMSISPMLIGGIAAATVGVAGVVVGAVLLAIHVPAANEWRNDPKESTVVPADANLGITFGGVALGVGAAAAGVGVGLLLGSGE
jgi:hypothetical protein